MAKQDNSQLEIVKDDMDYCDNCGFIYPKEKSDSPCPVCGKYSLGWN